jgi:hypothetical protein
MGLSDATAAQLARNTESTASDAPPRIAYSTSPGPSCSKIDALAAARVVKGCGRRRGRPHSCGSVLPTRCALGMHLLHATWIKLHAKNRQRRLTEPELTWLLTLTNPTHHR